MDPGDGRLGAPNETMMSPAEVGADPRRWFILAVVVVVASHGPRLAASAVVHGFTVAFAVGAIIVAAGALASALLVNAKPTDLANPAPEPAANDA